MTLGDWIDGWLGSRAGLQPATRERVAGIIERHIRPVLGRYPIGESNHTSLQDWTAQLALKQSAASVRKCVNVLSGALQAAVADGGLPANLARGLKLPKVITGRKRYLSHELALEVDRTGAGNGYGTLNRVPAYCGLRWSELSGLRVMDLDVRRGPLEVLHTVVEVGGRQLEPVPKDYEARSIPVPRSVLDELVKLTEGRAPESPVFAGARGGSWLRGRVFKRGWFDRAATAVGLEGLTPHELRHMAASLAISAGANLNAVQRMLGHASAAVTLDVYSDLFDSDLDAVSDALDHELRGTSVVRVLSRPETEEARN